MQRRDRGQLEGAAEAVRAALGPPQPERPGPAEPGCRRGSWEGPRGRSTARGPGSHGCGLPRQERGRTQPAASSDLRSHFAGACHLCVCSVDWEPRSPPSQRALSGNSKHPRTSRLLLSAQPGQQCWAPTAGRPQGAVGHSAASPNPMPCARAVPSASPCCCQPLARNHFMPRRLHQAVPAGQGAG